MIPISTTQDLADCLESLRRDCIRKNHAANTEQQATNDNLVCWCVEGKPLSRDQVNVLTGITSGFRGFADLYSSPGGQATICEYLGGSDGERVVSFLSNGPSHIREQPGLTDAHNIDHPSSILGHKQPVVQGGVAGIMTGIWQKYRDER
ncbi:unnamed protein product [Fusarium fujikuroi]|nr:unnamed protein product [Fusarium fujikuroi]